MIPTIQLGGLGRSMGSRSVGFVAASGSSYIAGGTSINSPSSPAGIANGDGLFAIVYARSALTPPAGWTLVASKSNGDGVTTQTVYVYRKDTVTSSDASTAFTWTQASSGRMGLAYVVARSTSGTITVAATSTAEDDYTVSGAYPKNVTAPTASATVNGELFLVAVSAVLASPTATENTWSAPTGATIRTTATQAENRLAAFTQARSPGQSNATPATHGVASQASSTNYYASVLVRLQP